MALNFVHTISLVNRNINIKCKELDFITYKNLTKTVYNDSPEDIDTYVNQVLKELVLNFPVHELDVFDKFTILAYLRYVNISPDLTLQVNCPSSNKSYDVKIDLHDMLQRLDDVKLEKNYIIKNANTNVKFQLPRSFDVNTAADVYVNSIQKITVGKKQTELEIPDYVDKTELLDKMPITFFNDFKKFLGKQETLLHEFVVFKYKSPYVESDEFTEYRFSFFDKSFLHLLNILFQENLQSLYEFEYDLYNFCRLPYDVVKNSTFSELQLIYNIELGCRQEQEGGAESVTPPGALPADDQMGKPEVVSKSK